VANNAVTIPDYVAIGILIMLALLAMAKLLTGGLSKQINSVRDQQPQQPQSDRGR